MIPSRGASSTTSILIYGLKSPTLTSAGITTHHAPTTSASSSFFVELHNQARSTATALNDTTRIIVRTLG